MLDKVTRIEKTVSILSLDLGFKEDTILVVQHAASLAMSDLATSIVTEFTSLSGVMARHYALYHGYSEKVNYIFFFTKHIVFYFTYDILLFDISLPSILFYIEIQNQLNYLSTSRVIRNLTTC